MGIGFIHYPDGLVQAELAERLALLHQAGFPAHEGWSAQAFSELLRLPLYHLCLFETPVEKGQEKPQMDFQGFLLYSCVAEEAEIVTFVVHPRFQGKGIGSQILESFLHKMQAGKVQSVFLEVAEENGAAFSLYKRYGFVIQGKRNHYYGQGRHALLMLRDLT